MKVQPPIHQMELDQLQRWSQYYLFQESLGEIAYIRGLRRDTSDEDSDSQTMAMSSGQTPMGCRSGQTLMGSQRDRTASVSGTSEAPGLGGEPDAGESDAEKNDQDKNHIVLFSGKRRDRSSIQWREKRST